MNHISCKFHKMIVISFLRTFTDAKLGKRWIYSHESCCKSSNDHPFSQYCSESSIWWSEFATRKNLQLWSQKGISYKPSITLPWKDYMFFYIYILIVTFYVMQWYKYWHILFLNLNYLTFWLSTGLYTSLTDI